MTARLPLFAYSTPGGWMADDPQDDGEQDQSPSAVIEALKAERDATKAKNAELVADKSRYIQTLKAFGDLTPETAAEAVRKAKEAEEAELSAAGKYDELKKRLQDDHKTSTEKLQAAIADKDARLERLLVQSELDRAMDEVGVLPVARKYVRSHLLEAAPKVKGEIGVFERADGDVPIAEAVRAWAESEEAGDFLASETRSGSGSRGSGGGAGGGQKWSTMNETQRAQMFKANPEEARRLAREAGQVFAA